MGLKHVCCSKVNVPTTESRLFEREGESIWALLLVLATHPRVRDHRQLFSRACLCMCVCLLHRAALDTTRIMSTGADKPTERWTPWLRDY